MRVAIPDNFPAFYTDDDPLLAPLRERAEIAVFSTRHGGESELIARMCGATVAINVRAYSRFSAEVFAALPQLRFLTVMGTGTDNVDLIAARQNNVVVSNTPAAPTVSVAEFTIGLMFAAAKNLQSMHRALQSGRWEQKKGIELRGKTFGFVGLGLIAAEMAPIIRALGMRTVGWSMTRDESRAGRLGVELLDFDDVLRQSDVLSLLLRASPRSHHIIGARELGLMKRTAYLINTGRGSLVDEAALHAALADHRIAGAALDVFETEPLPAGAPLAALENIIVTPHAAWVTDQGTSRMGRHPVENVLAFLDGKPRFVVN